MKILSWNIQGLGARSKKKAVHDRLRQYQVEMVCLQETKLEDIASSVSSRVTWCLCGDFNVVRLVSERQGCCGSVIGMENFGNFLNDTSLVDIPMQDDEDWGPRPFRFLNCWMDQQKHVHDMELEWARISMEGGEQPISWKLKPMKGFLKIWNKGVFGNVDHQIEDVTRRLDNLDMKKANDGVLDEEATRYFTSELWRLNRDFGIAIQREMDFEAD
ncbi:hypothetical protein V6N13_028328 [Hibiscus sabdariffa]